MDISKKEPKDLVLDKRNYLIRCQEIGKLVYEDTFRINASLIIILLHMRDYFLNKHSASRLGNVFQLNDPLFVYGASNSGKTALMVILKSIVCASKSFRIKSCLEIEHQFKTYGEEYVVNLLNDESSSWCFDDFGKRSTESHLKILKILIEKITDSNNNNIHHIVSDFTLEQLEKKLGIIYYNKIKSSFKIIKT